jgi:NAD(P)-dependent dehydrogenase (short-subunit alcohol dehydrogenase family)
MSERGSEVVVVTGAGGMGVAVCRRIGSGRTVVLADYDEAALGRVAEQLRNEGHAIREAPTDVSDEASVTALAGVAADAGVFRALVHTAGVSPVQATPERIVDVDVVGTALVLDAFEALAGPGSVAVCIASMAGTMTRLPPDVETLLATTPTSELRALPALAPTALDAGAAYGIAKRANQLRVQAASIRWGARGARVVSISPGIISTPMGQQELGGPSGDFMRDMVRRSGTGRVGTPDDIAAAVAFLVSADASFITGTDLLVDGGVIAALSLP